MGRIRAFVQDDIPRVAQLYWQFLQGQRGTHPPSLERYFLELFFHNPWFDSSIRSLVYEEGQRRVNGFLGIVPRPMSISGKPMQAAFGSSLVVHPESRPTLAGPKLLTAFMDGKQDLALTDTSSRLGQQIWVGLGGSTSAEYGLKWARPLRFGLYGLSRISQLGEEGFSGSRSRACGVLHKTIDAVAAKIPLGSLRRPLDGVTEEELEIETLLHSCLPISSERYSVRPEYNKGSLKWLLDFMNQMKGFGNLRKVVLRSATREIIGWFIYFAKRGGIAEVVQIGVVKRDLKTVLNHLFSDAWNNGATAVHGRLEIRHAQELSEARCFLWATVPLLFHARDQELARLIQLGDVCLSRLDGEWSLRYGTREPERTNVVLNLANKKESSTEAADKLAPGNFQPSQPLPVKAAK